MGRLGTETAFKALAQVNRLKAEGQDIISFALGEPDFDTPQNIKDAAVKTISDGYAHYSLSAGILPPRKSIAHYISETRSIEVKPEEIVVTPGAKALIFDGILSCINEGDEVIYPNVTEAHHSLSFHNSKELQQYLLDKINVAVLARNCLGQRNQGEKEEYIRLSCATSLRP